MLYVPMLKLRSMEQKALKCVGECLFDKIIPKLRDTEDIIKVLGCSD